jgi:hypothetical protein
MNAENMNQTEPQKKGLPVRPLLIAAGFILIGIVGYLASQQEDLFKASITTTGSPTNVARVYIPDNYKATSPSGETGYLEIKAGADLGNIGGLQAKFDFDSSKLTVGSGALTTSHGTYVNQLNINNKSGNTKELDIRIAYSSSVNAVTGTVLTKIVFQVPAGVSSGSRISLTNTFTKVTNASNLDIGVSSIPANNVIEIVLRPCTDSDWACSVWSACDSAGNRTRTCRDAAELTSVCSGSRPSVASTCTCTASDWNCVPSGACSDQGKQPYTCTKVGCTGGDSTKPSELRDCIPIIPEQIAEKIMKIKLQSNIATGVATAEELNAYDCDLGPGTGKDGKVNLLDIANRMDDRCQ